MAAVVFDPAAFKVRYPEFSAVSDALLGQYFEEAGLYLSNGDCSPVDDLKRRALLLNMLTAHIATLNGAGTGKLAPVGRMSSASEGSVSVSFDAQVSNLATWFTQTQYGLAFWQATSGLRSFRYISQPTRW